MRPGVMNFMGGPAPSGGIAAAVVRAVTQSSSPPVVSDPESHNFLTSAERAAGVTTAVIDGVHYRDLSVPVNAMLTSNANEARAQIRGVPAGLPFGFNANLFRALDYANRYRWILENFPADHRWDFKYPQSWDDQFQGIPFRGEYAYFVVDGVIMKPADLGNVNFGYATSALGISTPVQLIGAGLAHINDHGLYHAENLLHFGDSPRCRYFTDMGRRWYRQGR